LRRAERLESLKPNNTEALLAVAQAALDTKDFKRAREKAEAALRMDPREGIYLLLADIEEAETNDQGRIRHWMGQALRAPRDPAWVADGLVSERWLPLSPTSGRLDAFEWKRPFGQLEGPIEEGTLSAETAIASLPPVNGPQAEPKSVVTVTPEAKIAAPAKPAAPARTKTASPGVAAPPKPNGTGKASDEPAPDPFFGRAPDDPGVRDADTAREPSTRLHLF
jgi:HemY protein